MPLASTRLKTVVAYPVVEPPLRWAIGAALIWDKITIIWDPDDRASLNDYATRTPVLLDHGLVELEKPDAADVAAASSKLKALRNDPSMQLPADSEFASTFALHPVKATNAYWDNVRRSADGFVRVPPQLGSLYVGLLAEEMAARAEQPTVSMRYEEPLILAGATARHGTHATPEDCVVRASLEVLNVELKNSAWSSESELVEKACHDIVELRKLDGWYSWREQVCKYLDALAVTNPASDTVATASSEMQSAIRRYEKEASRQRWTTVGKIVVALAGGVVGFFVGSVPGAIAAAATGGATLGIDLYHGSAQKGARRPGWQQFVLAARKRFS